MRRAATSLPEFCNWRRRTNEDSASRSVDCADRAGDRLPAGDDLRTNLHGHTDRHCRRSRRRCRPESQSRRGESGDEIGEHSRNDRLGRVPDPVSAHRHLRGHRRIGGVQEGRFERHPARSESDGTNRSDARARGRYRRSDGQRDLADSTDRESDRRNRHLQATRQSACPSTAGTSRRSRC